MITPMLRMSFLLVLSLAVVHCGSAPVTCYCHEVWVVTDNNTRISGTTLRIVVPDRPLGFGFRKIIPGAYVIGDFSFCRAGVVALEVSHPQYRTQRIDITIPRNIDVGGSAECAVPRPPPVYVRLVPNP
jgi:hypothetical protein